jgi:hypothetical protein
MQVRLSISEQDHPPLTDYACFADTDAQAVILRYPDLQDRDKLYPLVGELKPRVSESDGALNSQGEV